jgi:hypothetical protein
MSGLRSNYCWWLALLKDYTCPEETQKSILGHVVKLLNKHSGILTPMERNHKIHPDLYDGITEIDEENVG